MSLKDTKTLSEISQKAGIGTKTLYKRFEKLVAEKELIENEDYRKLGKNQPIIFSKEGAEKIIKQKNE